MNYTKQLVQAIDSGDKSAAKEAFSKAIEQTAQQACDIEKIKITSQVYNREK